MCLYADFRPRQLDTLVYLCNRGPGVLAEIEVVIDEISMHEFYKSAPDERWTTVHSTQEMRCDAMLPGECVLINTLSHYMWDVVSRYSLNFTDATGQRRTAEADDLTLNACRLGRDPAAAWVVFDIAGPAGQTARPDKPGDP